MARQTSIDAYKIKSEGLLSERRWQVYDVLYEIGPATGGEVFKAFKKKYGVLVPTNSNTITRLGELRNCGVVKEIGTRECTVSGQNVIVWQVTDKLPVKFKKEERIKCKHCNGKGYSIQQQSRLF